MIIFKKNNIEAIAGCHAVYLTGIPLEFIDKKISIVLLFQVLIVI